MLFNSLAFLFFFPAVVLGHFLLPQRARWVFLLLASWFFYGYWRPEYLLLLIGSTSIDWLAALGIERSASRLRRRALLALSLSANLGILFAFKYYGFFADSAAALSRLLGSDARLPVLEVLLPVGISFYTFQSMSYTVDVYLGRLRAERNPGFFALYVAYFPQLVAGPIERATRLLPQLRAAVSFDAERASSGLRLMLWGFFKKLVIADRLAPLVNEVYKDPSAQAGAPLLLATLFFAFQIYCDFSGYSDIAVGAARVLGVDLMRNFKSPYRARSIPEFWQRWHISLSTWFRDYLYFPLGGNRVGRLRHLVNLGVVFLVSGLWHGANWSFVIWGALHGFAMAAHVVSAPWRAWLAAQLARLPGFYGLLAWLTTFAIVLASWVFFRAADLPKALAVFRGLFSGPFLPDSLNGLLPGLGRSGCVVVVAALLLLAAVQHLQETGRLERFFRAPRWIRWMAYEVLALVVLFFGEFNHSAFIYFQF